MHQHFASVRLLNEIIQHALGHFEIGDHAVFHGLDRDDVAGSSPQHLFRLFAHGFDFAVVLVDRDNGRFIDDNALPFGKDQRVGRTQVNREVRRKQTK